MAVVYLGLGANLGDRAANILAALAALGRHGIRLRMISPIYETEPWGLLDQPRFLNGVCQVSTRMAPLRMIEVLKAIEHELGRVTTVRYGPRPIDLDILLYGDEVISTPELMVPHAGMLQRATVLVPLADIAPEIVHPLSGRTVRQHLAELGEVQGVLPYPLRLTH